MLPERANTGLSDNASNLLSVDDLTELTTPKSCLWWVYLLSVAQKHKNDGFNDAACGGSDRLVGGGVVVTLPIACTPV